MLQEPTTRSENRAYYPGMWHGNEHREEQGDGGQLPRRDSKYPDGRGTTRGVRTSTNLAQSSLQREALSNKSDRRLV